MVLARELKALGPAQVLEELKRQSWAGAPRALGAKGCRTSCWLKLILALVLNC